MAKKPKNPKPIDLKKVGKTLVKLADTKRRLIEASIRSGDRDYARRTLENTRVYVRIIRQELQEQLREGILENLTPEAAQQAIYGCQILEESLRLEEDRPH